MKVSRRRGVTPKYEVLPAAVAGIGGALLWVFPGAAVLLIVAGVVLELLDLEPEPKPGTEPERGPGA